MTGGRSSPLTAGVVLLAGLAASASADMVELWRAESDSGVCRIELVNDLGGVRLDAAAAGEASPAVRGAPDLAVAPAAATPAKLTVTRAGPPTNAPGDVELLVPRGCDVTVRTTAGEVSLAVTRETLSAAVHTITGDITAWIDPAADAAVAFATSGEITSDFSVEIDFRYHQEPAKHGQITPSSDSPRQGGPNQVQLASRRGAIRMLRPDTSYRDARAETPDDRHVPD